MYELFSVGFPKASPIVRRVFKSIDFDNQPQNQQNQQVMKMWLKECPRSAKSSPPRSWISGDALASESASNRPPLGGVLKIPPTLMAHEVKGALALFALARIAKL